MRVVVAPDKFKGTASARSIADAIAEALADLGNEPIVVPMADGGEGTLEALGGPNRSTTVTGPLGAPVEARWRMDGKLAVIEMAQASGLVVAGGAEANDPIDATTRGTGELIAAAVARGAKRVIVGVGGSATTDGGLGAIEAIGSGARLAGVRLTVATDVTTEFVDAARIFGPQKGASPAQVAFLEARLKGLAERYRTEYDVEVEGVAGAGAAGGLAGGLMAVGAELMSGFELIAEEVGLYESIETADLVVTGEGRLDAESFAGKVVGGVIDIAGELDVPVGVIAGAVADDVGHHERVVATISLVERFGLERALADPAARCRDLVPEVLTSIVD